MKKINLLFVALIGAMTLTLTSCDECKDVTCENGGTCAEGVCDCADNFFGDACEVECVNGSYADGTCTCDDGYNGDACNMEDRADFIGNWSYTTACAPGESFDSEITEVSDNVLRVTITNLTGFNDKTAYAVIDGTSISVPSQNVTDEDSDTWTLESTSNGTLADGKFSMTIKGSVNGGEVTCVLEFSKK